MAKYSKKPNSKVLQKDYSTEESAWLFKELYDLPSFIRSFGFDEVKSDQPGKQLDFVRGKERITVTHGYNRWVWCVRGEKEDNSNNKHGHLQFLQDYCGASSKGEAFAMLREHARNEHGANYKAFILGYIQRNPGFSHPDIESIPNTVSSKPKNETKLQSSKKEIKDYPFQPGDDLSFILDRGISQETIDHPLFKGRFGNSSGTFGGFNPKGEDPETDISFSFKNHLIVPINDISGRVVGLEAKNKLTDEKFAQLLATHKAEDGQLRKNQSDLYAGSARLVWMSNVPENPTQIFLAEQPMDAMAYFDLHKGVDPKMSETIFITTGGNLTDEQAKSIAHFADKHKIDKIVLGFDNDASGLKYTVKSISELLVQTKEQEFDLKITQRKSDQKHDIVFLSNSRTKGSSKELHEKIKDLVGKHGVEGEYIPNLLFNENLISNQVAQGQPDEASIQAFTIGALTFSYSTKQSRSIVSLASELYDQRERMIHVIPDNSKDWNDALQGKENAPSGAGTYIIDSEEYKNKLMLDGKGNLVLMNRFIDPETIRKEAVGVFRLYNPKNRYAPNKVNNFSPELLGQIQRLNIEFANEIPPLTKEWIKEVITQGFEFRDNAFYKRGSRQSVVTYNGVGKEPTFSDLYPFNEIERMAISWQCAALDRGLQPRPLLESDYADLYYHREDNGPLRFDPKDGTISIAWPAAEFDAKENKWILLNGPYKLNEEQKRFLASNDQDRPPHGLTREHGQILVEKPLVQISLKGIEKYFSDENILENDLKVIQRMVKLLEKGLDPNRPGFIGRMNNNLEIDFVPNFEKRLTMAGREQLDILMNSMDGLRPKLTKFLERLEEPFIKLKSEDMILKDISGGSSKPIVQYDHKTDSLKWLLPKNELATRPFNKAFFKTVQLFKENKGVFHNYVRDIKYREENLYYKNQQAQIGLVFEVDGKKKYSLREGLPKAMVRELEMFSSIEKATVDEIRKQGINVEGSIKLRNKKNTAIPLEYSNFFHNSKLVYKSDVELEALKTKNTDAFDRYIEAEIWWLNNNPNQAKGKEPSISPQALTITDHQGLLKLGRVPVCKYNPETDKFDMLSQPAKTFFAQIALFELQYVKDPKNRQFKEYVFDEKSENTKVNNSEVAKLLSEMVIVGNETDGYHINILHKQGNLFDKAKIAELKGNQLFVNSELITFSPVLGSALKELSDKRKLLIIETEFNQAPAPSVSLKEPEIKNVTTENHSLALLGGNVISSINTFPGLKGVLDIDNNDLNLISVKGDYFSINEPAKGSVVGPIPEDKKIMVVSEHPKDLVYWAQQNYHLAIHDQVQFISMKGLSHEDQRKKIDKTISVTPYQKLVFIGDNSFLNNVGQPLTRGGISVELINELEASKSLTNLKSLSDKFSADKKIEDIVGRIPNLALSPVPGISVVPMSSSTSKSITVLGGKDKHSADLNSIWVQGNLKTARSVTLLANVREAMAYLSLNREFNNRMAIIAFNEVPNQESVNYAARILVEKMSALKTDRELQPKDMIYVANSYHLSEKLSQLKFPFEFRVQTTQFKTASFQEEIVKVMDNLAEAKNDLSLQRVNKSKEFSPKFEAHLTTASTRGLKHEAKNSIDNEILR